MANREVTPAQLTEPVRYTLWHLVQYFLRLGTIGFGGPVADVIFTHIKSDFAAVGITAQRVGMTAPADLRLLDSVARYARVDWYFNQFACAAGHNPCSDMADSKAEQAEAESDPVKRSSLLEDAEAALTLSNIFIPLGTPVRWSLVRGQLSGFAPNARSWHPLGPVAIRQK